MTPGRSAQAALFVLFASASAWPALAQDGLVRNLIVAADPQPFTADDLLWMQVQADGVEVADTLNVYSSRSGVFVPIGELSRVLDLAVGVFPAQRRAEGWILSPDRKLVVDLGAGEARLDGRRIAIGAGQAAIYDNDLYVRTDLLEQLMPLKFKADASAQVLTLTPTEPLPFQQRAERAARQSQLGGGDGDEAAVRLGTPYRWASPPSFDVNVGGQLARDGVDQAGRYDVRIASDLLHAGFEGYVGSDDDGQVNTVRVMLSRKDPYGHALGPLGGTRAGVGDVFTPSMPIGAAGYGGRGLFYTSAPLENLDLATPLNLRGELTLGEEVELYVNEVLQRAQTSPVQGRYEFLDVPLAFGLNTIRLVFYGSQGQSREVVRRINFGTGQVEPGRVVMRLGAIEQGVNVFDVGGGQLTDRAAGAARVTAMIDYGLTSGLTLSAGAARYNPQGTDGRSLGSLGLRGSLGGVAVQIDGAFDDQGGRGVSSGFATRAYGVSLVGRHSEYGGGFIDETRQLGVTDQAPLARATDLRADGQIGLSGALTVPVSLNIRRLQRVDGGRLTNAELRGSAPISRYYVSSSVAFEEDSQAVAVRRRWLGATDVASLVTARLQTRAGVTYELSPDPQLDTAYATADWQFNDRSALRVGMVRTLGPQSATSFQASQLWRADRFDLAVNLAYETSNKDLRLGLQLGFGFGYDPGRGRYEITRPGIAGGGAVAVNAWVDENGDGLRQPDEPGVAGIVADTPAGGGATAANGRLFMTGLGDGATARIRLNAEGIEDPFLIGGPTTLQIVPRPGHVTEVAYPMLRSAEVQVTALLRRPGVDPRPLSALSVELVPEKGGAPIAGRSDHAGVVFVETVPPGAYSIRLDPAQAQALGVSLVEAARVVVPPNGGFVNAGSFEVEIQGGTVQ